MPYKNREKQLAAQRAHYRKNKEKFTDRTVQRRIERSKWWAEYKEQMKFTCECGESHPACIAFHHSDPTEKRKSVADLVVFGYPVDVILEEISKCEVMCHNCHAKHHWENDARRRND